MTDEKLPTLASLRTPIIDTDKKDDILVYVRRNFVEYDKLRTAAKKWVRECDNYVETVFSEDASYCYDVGMDFKCLACKRFIEFFGIEEDELI